ncbi:MAG: type II secretion system protein GspD [Verrucomicrobia bacterium]|nr:MAG: type II secretion system protein GspD [Verrucomicrobiota bacterium]
MNAMSKKFRGALVAALLLAPALPVPSQITPAPVAHPPLPAIPAPGVVPHPPAPVGPGTNVAATHAVAMPVTTNSASGIQLNFRDAPLDQLLNMYGDLTGRTIIRAPQVAAAVTLRSQSPLTTAEAIHALESALALNNISLVAMGPKFSKVVKSEMGRAESLELQHGGQGKPAAETDQLVSYIFTLKYMEPAEALPVLQSILHTYGKIQQLDRANSLLISDTSANIQRIQEILEFMDQPPEARVEVRVYTLEHGDAATIATQLTSLLDDTQAISKPRTPPQMPFPIPVPTMPGVARPSSAANISEGVVEGGLIQGKVKILSDDRTNILIIIARPSNFPFFEQIIKEMDRKVDPETVIRVVTLQWANADEVAGLLNDMLGTSGGSYGTRGSSMGGTSSTLGGATGTGTSSGSRSLGSSTSGSRTSASRSRTAATSSRNRTATSRSTPTSTGSATAGVNPFGNNAPNVTISTRVLADLRTNALLLMGTKEDIADLEKVIEKLDVMLSQVLIEAVILEVDLNKTSEFGVNWLQRSLQAYNQTAAGPGGGLKVNQPVAAFGGGWNSGTASATMPDAAAIGRNFAMPGGLNYYTTISGLNLDAVIHMVNRSTDARVLSTPVIMATDNETAEIKNTQERPVITSSTLYTTGTGATSSTYEYKDIGIDLLVRPHINPNRMVQMDITQTADTIAGEQTIDNNQVPIINKREIQGLITVEDRTTIVLGGLVEKSESKSRDSIPLLGSIPLIGWLFRNDNNTTIRTELLVLITPYVLKTPEEARAETKRLHKNSNMEEVLIRGWSDSPLAKPDPELAKALQKKTLFGKRPTPAAPVAMPTNAVPVTPQ